MKKIIRQGMDQLAKSVYEFWMRSGVTSVRFPVLPEKLDMETQGKNESFDITAYGEITVIQKPGAKIFSFSAFFPKHQGPYCEFKMTKTPAQLRSQIETWMNQMYAVHFIVTGAGINTMVSIESFKVYEKAGEIGDLYFDITLKSFKLTVVNKIKIKKKQPVKKTTRPNTLAKARTHKVKSGDTLWAISKKYYGNHNDWRKIWNKNKTMMIKRDKKNVKQPGHWIYPGQTLIIP